MLSIYDLKNIEADILLTGETGSGKNHSALKIHNHSVRSHSPFLAVNICSLNKNVFESELFGHAKGSYTGAHCDKVGFLEKTQKGTLFIDEIGDLSLELQVKLLSVIETKEYFCVGSSIKKRFNGRFIFATNKNLKEEIRKGYFREDLYHRIKTFNLTLRPLREHDDLKETVVNQFLSMQKNADKKSFRLNPKLLKFLLGYDWPGNYRELKELSIYLTTLFNREVSLEDLPSWIDQSKENTYKGDNYYKALSSFESSFLYLKLLKFNGKINETAKNINISKVTLLSKIKKYNINVLSIKLEKIQRETC